MQVEIDDKLVEALVGIAEENGFKDVQALIDFVLNDVKNQLSAKHVKGMTPEESAEISSRLGKLGYLG